MSPRSARFALAAALLLSGALLRRSSAPTSQVPEPAAAQVHPSAPAAPTPHVVSDAEQASSPAASTAPAEALPQGVTGIWHGRFERPLSSLAPTDTHDFTPPVDLVLPVSAAERIPIRLHRFDIAGTNGGTFSGEVVGRPGATVVLSYVGAAQAGVIYLPDQDRSFVINGGDDGSVRITATDLPRAPGCAPEVPRPPKL